MLTRIIDVPADKLFKCWTTPERMHEWFCPKPWTVSRAEMDIRAGGSSLVVMRSPEGQEFPNPGVYLEVVPNKAPGVHRRLHLGLGPVGEAVHGSRSSSSRTWATAPPAYTATARHWTVEDRKAHEQMGFHEGWGVVADQLAEVARTF